MNRPTKNRILILHDELIKVFRGIDGVRDENLLESAVESPFQTFGGQDLYPSIIEKAARLCYCLIKNHPFLDGNKRIGTHAMLSFLEINGVDFECDENDLIDVIFCVADNSISYEMFVDWLEQHTK